MTQDNNETVHRGQKWRESKKLLVFVVTVALFMDNLLVSIIVPIIPKYLQEIEQSKARSNENLNTSTAENSTHVDNLPKLKNETYPQPKLTQETTTGGNPTNEMIPNEKGTAALRSTNISQLDQSETEISYDSTNEYSLRIGILFGSKPFVQILANFFVGPCSNRYGYSKLMFVGFIIIFLSTLLFAVGESYEVLFIARALQGVGSSCTSVAGLAGLAERYKVNEERETAIRTAVGAIVLGILVGPPFGGFTYEYFGKSCPFFILCGLAFIDGFLQYIMIQPKRKKEENVKSPSIVRLLKDPYILIVAGGLLLLCGEYALIETVLPIWTLKSMKLSSSQLGMIFLPYPITFILVLNVFAKFFLRMDRWLLLMLGSIIIAFSMIMFPFCRNMIHLLVPSLILGLGAGMANAAINPEFAHLMDIRYTPIYGNVYAIGELAVCLGLALGPFCGGMLYKYFGFSWIMCGGGVAAFLYSPLPYFLKNVPIKNEKMLQALEEKKVAVRLIKNRHDDENR